jgi:hypothetical protein
MPRCGRRHTLQMNSLGEESDRSVPVTRYDVHVFAMGDRVQLAERYIVDELMPAGTVVGFAEGDVLVRWDTGLEAGLAPWSLAPATPPERAG